MKLKNIENQTIQFKQNVSAKSKFFFYFQSFFLKRFLILYFRKVKLNFQIKGLRPNRLNNKRKLQNQRKGKKRKSN